MSSRKRARPAEGDGAAAKKKDYKSRSRATDVWARKQWPQAKYYRRYYPRTEESLAKYGQSWATAEQPQKEARTADMMIGRGIYGMRKALKKPVMGLAHRGVDMLGDRVFGKGLYMGGRGQYHTNTLFGTGEVPSFGSVGDETGAITISHSEYIRDVYGLSSGNTFEVQSLSVNPGLANSFPFLSQFASNFEEYEMLQLAYTYKSLVSENLSSTDGQVGSVLLFTEYNAADKPKTSKYQIMQGYGHTDGKVTDNLLHGVECDDKKIVGDGHKFVRTRPVDADVNADINKYDVGLFQLAVSGTPAALADQVIGELHVSYTVRLRKPRIYAGLGLTQSRSEFIWKRDGASGTNERMWSTQSTGFLSNAVNNIDVKFSEGTNEKDTVVTFPAGFVGDVEILCQYADGSPSMTGELTMFEDTFVSGNVTKLSMLPLGATSVPAQDGASLFIGGTGSHITQAGNINILSARCMFHLEIATSNVDNAITFRSAPAATNQGMANPGGYFHFVVQRINNSESSGLQTFLDEAGAIATLPTTF